jgi:uncharacterized membrane protein (UPF0127 family)
MQFLPKAVCALAGILLLAGCGNSGPAGAAPRKALPAVDPVHGHLLEAQTNLPTISVRVGAEELIAEIARKPVEIATGMMFRTNMLENEAMLFVFTEPDQQSFYMRNCVVPLSAAYINPKGEILQIAELHPGDEMGVLSYSEDIQFVLEVRQGWFKRHNIGVGAVVRTEKGSLRETFFGN